VWATRGAWPASAELESVHSGDGTVAYTAGRVGRLIRRPDDHGGAEPVTLLETISSPRDLRKLSPDQLPLLASEIRDVLIETVSRNSGHLGPNLGVVELTIALHRVFDSPFDKIVFDVGHQAYVHKLLTGRHAELGTLRRAGGGS